jgi:hypothetical protein
MLMGRPRQQHRHMPPGVRQVAGKWYWRPTNEPTRAVRDRLWPGRKSVTAGDSTDAEGARQWWVQTILPALAAPPDLLSVCVANS